MNLNFRETSSLEAGICDSLAFRWTHEPDSKCQHSQILEELFLIQSINIYEATTICQALCWTLSNILSHKILIQIPQCIIYFRVLGCSWPLGHHTLKSQDKAA